MPKKDRTLFTLRYECYECGERFHRREFQSHVSISGHCGGQFNKDLSERCLVETSRTAWLPMSELAAPARRRDTRKLTAFDNSTALPSTSELATTSFRQTSFQDIPYPAASYPTAPSHLAAAVPRSTYEDLRAVDEEEESDVSMQDGDGTFRDSNAEDPSAGEVFDDDSSAVLQKLKGYFSCLKVAGVARGNVLADIEHSVSFEESAMIGELIGSSCHHPRNVPQHDQNQQVFLNTHEPFCLVTVGVQGGGKSHTLATVLEGCLIPFPEGGYCRLKKPMATLVLHYDESTTARCEATGLSSPAAQLRAILGDKAAARCISKERMTILVSPSYYKQRKNFYKGLDCNVKPLLLQWSSLTANHIKSIMGVSDTDNQLYISTMLQLLKRYQRADQIPPMDVFFKEVKSICKVSGQAGPLDQRIALLEGLIAESAINQGMRGEGGDLHTLCMPGHLVVADMTDPLLSKADVNGIFQVLVEQYRTLPHPPGSGRLLALDEAHKYMDGAVTDGLSAAIVNIARLMRHDGIRLVVGTQSPLALAPELLELLTVAVIHRFHSVDWFSYLKVKIPLDAAAWPRLLGLEPGEALVFASRHKIALRGDTQGDTADGVATAHTDRTDQYTTTTTHTAIHTATHSINHPETEMTHYPFGRNIFEIKIRPRFTADIGASSVNRTKRPKSGEK